jgi:hypothetical protein
MTTVALDPEPSDRDERRQSLAGSGAHTGARVRKDLQIHEFTRVLKTAGRASVPWVQIPPPPPQAQCSGRPQRRGRRGRAPVRDHRRRRPRRGGRARPPRRATARRWLGRPGAPSRPRRGCGTRSPVQCRTRPPVTKATRPVNLSSPTGCRRRCSPRGRASVARPGRPTPHAATRRACPPEGHMSRS